MKLLHCGGMVGMKCPVMLCDFPRRMDASNVTLYVIRGHLTEGQSVSLLYDSMCVPKFRDIILSENYC
jgi:hypothetical protein